MINYANMKPNTVFTCMFALAVLTAGAGRAADIQSWRYGNKNLGAIDPDYYYTPPATHTWSGTDDDWDDGHLTVSNGAELVISGEVDYPDTGGHDHLTGGGAMKINNGGKFRHLNPSGRFLKIQSDSRMEVGTEGSGLVILAASGAALQPEGASLLLIGSGGTLEVNHTGTVSEINADADSFILDDGTIDIVQSDLSISGGTATGGLIRVGTGCDVTVGSGTWGGGLEILGDGLLSIPAGDGITVGGGGLYIAMTNEGAAWMTNHGDGSSIHLIGDLVSVSEFVFGDAPTVGGGHFGGSGAFILRCGGELIVNGRSALRVENSSRVDIEADSACRLISNMGGLELRDGTSMIIVREGGTIAADCGSGETDVCGSGTLDILAGSTVAVHSAELAISASDIRFDGVGTPGTLGAGTFLISDSDGAGTNSSTLDIRIGNITTIDTNATVTLVGPDAYVANDNALLENTLTTIDGGFGLHSGRQWSNANALGMSDSTRLEFGLVSADATNALLAGSADITVDGTLSVVDCGGMEPGRYVVITNAAGTLTDAGIEMGTVPERYGGKLIVHTGTTGYVVLNLFKLGTVLTVF